MGDFAKVGDPRLKCRGGRWSSSNPPLCAGGSCDSSKVPKVYFNFKSTQSIFYHTITAGCITKIRSNTQISARTSPSNTGGPSLITNASQDLSEYK